MRKEDRTKEKERNRGWRKHKRICRSCVEERRKCDRNRYIKRCNMHRLMKLHPYKL